MGFKIEDGTGTGVTAKVTSENMLKTFSITSDAQQHVNHDEAEAYSVIVSKTPSAAADCFLYIQNNSDDYMNITSIKLYAASDETIEVKLGDEGTAVGGSTNTPVNRNLGSGHTADVTCEDGVDITGLSGGDVVDQMFIDGATSTKKFSWTSGLIIPKNKLISFYAVTGGIEVKATVSLYFHNGS